MRLADCHSDRKYYAHGMCYSCWKREWRTEHHDHVLAGKLLYREANRERLAAKQLDYYYANREERNRKNAEYTRNRRKLDINFRLAGVLRARLRGALKNNQKAGSAVQDLGCSIGAFRLYIENQFESGMSWDNYGEWHLDHVMPLASFDLSNRTQFLEAANWLNYQPMWAADNIRKKASMPTAWGD